MTRLSAIDFDGANPFASKSLRGTRLARLDRPRLGDRLGMGLRHHGVSRESAAGASVAADLDGRPLTTVQPSRPFLAACRSRARR